MRVVIDTSVLVSALIKPNGVSAKCVDALVAAKAVILFDERMFDEYLDVLSRSSLGFPRALVVALLVDVLQAGERIEAVRFDVDLPDESDRPFIEVAVSGKGNVLVTGNKKHFPASLPVRIASPSELIANLDP